MNAARAQPPASYPAFRDRVRALALETPLMPVAVAVVLGLFWIGAKSFWEDEAFSVSVTRLPTVDLLVYLWRNELHTSPYTVALQPWTALGTGEAEVRALSVVFGVLAVLATYAVGKRYGVALSAASLLAVMPFFVEFEQEARGYTLVAAWSAIATLAYLRLTEKPTRLRAAVYVIAGVAAIYVHPFDALVIGAHGVATLFFVGREARLRILALFIPIVIGWLPMVRFMLIRRDVLYWVPPLTPELALDYALALGGGVILTTLLVVLLALRMKWDLPAVWILVPIVTAVAISQLIQPSLQPKYLIGILPPIAIVVARNRAIAVVAVVAISLVGVYGWYANGVKPDWRSGTAWVASRAQPGDGILFVPHWTRMAFAYYGHVGEPLYPSVPWDDLYLPAWGLEIDIPPDVDNQRIWLIQQTTQRTPPDIERVPDVARVLEGYLAVESRSFGRDGPEMTLLVKTP